MMPNDIAESTVLLRPPESLRPWSQVRIRAVETRSAMVQLALSGLVLVIVCGYSFFARQWLLLLLVPFLLYACGSAIRQLDAPCYLSADADGISISRPGHRRTVLWEHVYGCEWNCVGENGCRLTLYLPDRIEIDLGEMSGDQQRNLRDLIIDFASLTDPSGEGGYRRKDSAVLSR